MEVRGEDVPLFVKELSKKGKKAIGFTGQDLFREWCLRERERELQVVKVIEWNDSSALFLKPVLCLIGPKEKKLSTIPKKAKVAVSDKYVAIAKKYLNLLEMQGFKFEKLYLSGSVESACSSGIADIAIDIVYSGSTLIKEGLVVYDKIFASDFVIIGMKGVFP
ncbi:MAG: hypothetical protein V1859_06380 [archaeon]